MGTNLLGHTTPQLDQLHSWRKLHSDACDEQPVRIYTLGRFSIQSNHQPIKRPPSRNQRPIELLQALIAFGGREVHEEILSQALWPDADGDNARTAFEVTLHRLRRIFGIDNLFIIRDRRLTLNNSLAWADVWEFEQLINHGERLLIQAKGQAIVRPLRDCSDRLLHIYQGSFLEREPTRAWALTLRERLRSKLLRHILDVGQIWERAGDWQAATRVYRKGLEIDPLTESFYQRLMICFRESGQIAEALAIFHQCKKVLDEYFQVAPSGKTLDLSTSLLKSAAQR